jgi:hypothetical protein
VDGLDRNAWTPCSGISGRNQPEYAAIDEFVAVYNPQATPFEWRKEVVHSVPLAQAPLR